MLYSLSRNADERHRFCPTHVAPFYARSYNSTFPLVSNASINTNLDGEIQVTEATAYNGAILVNNLGISDMTGVEVFTSLTHLECYNNNLTFGI